MESTKNMIDAHAISLMKKNVVVLNFSRDVLVDSEAMVDALVSGSIKCYVTDFPVPEITGVKGAIVIPHLGASTEESEDNCAKMAVDELRNFLENGNIAHSVNYPNCDMGIKEKGVSRITILHYNKPKMLGQFTGLLAEEGINIALMTNKSRQEYAYTMIDVETEISDGIYQKLCDVNGVLKVRIIA